MCSNSHKVGFEFPKISLAFLSKNVKIPTAKEFIFNCKLLTVTVQSPPSLETEATHEPSAFHQRGGKYFNTKPADESRYWEKLFSSLLLHYSIQIKRSILWDTSV